MNKKISVIMSVYNGEEYLKEAIESILNQTFKQFELIIINDGSTDKSKEIIQNFIDKRIVYLENEMNKGLIYSLNYGLAKARGKYIARMDADDISYLNRFEIQYNYLEKNKDVDLLGGQAKFFYSDKKERSTKLPLTYDDIKLKLLFSNPFIHPTIMFRKEIYEAGFKYEVGLNGAEDFGLWQDLLYKYKCVNLSKELIKYRVLNNSITRVYNKKIVEKFEVHKKIYKKSLGNININLTEEELAIYTKVCIGYIDNCIDKKNELKKINEILLKILENYGVKNVKLLKIVLYRYLVSNFRLKKVDIYGFLKLIKKGLY